MKSRIHRWSLLASMAVFAGCTTSTPAANASKPPLSGSVSAIGSGAVAGSARVVGLKQPFGVAAAEDSIWVTEYGAGNLVRIDPKTMRVIARTRVGSHASYVVVQSGVVWVVDDLGGNVIGVDTRTNLITKTIPLRPTANLRPSAIAAADGAIWVTLGFENQATVTGPSWHGLLVRILPTTTATPESLSLTGILYGLTVGGGAVWVASQLEPSTVYRIDPATRQVVATIPTGHPISSALAYLAPDLWVANQDGYLTQIDARTNRVVGNFEVGSPEWPALVASANAIWISAPLDNLVARFDPQTHEISTALHTGGRPQLFAFTAGAIWVANYVDGTLEKLPLP
jgi:DNA-binding beta-propeller fold protein YncE